MVLGMAHLCRGRFRRRHVRRLPFRRLDDEAGDRRAGFQPEFGADDLGLEIDSGEHTLDVRTRVAVPAVWADGVPGNMRRVGQLLDGEDEPSACPQRASCRCNYFLEWSEVYKGVRRN